jgi:tRNA pseudouridine55 synthase
MAGNTPPPQPLDGILVVDKPAGPTSHDVVDRVRRAIGVRRIGHTGTLDPFATGVLALVVGRATRLAQFLTAADKAYDATIRLGIATDTYDLTGRVAGASPGSPDDGLPPGAAFPDRAAVEQVLATFLGTYPQAPPPFSAKKIDGVRAYVKARQGTPVEPRPVVVSAHELALESVEGGVVRVRIRCSTGFYVRALAHALGERLGVGAHLEALRRTRSAGFGIDDAVRSTASARGRARRPATCAASDALPHLPAALTESGAPAPLRHSADRGRFLAPAARDRAIRLIGLTAAWWRRRGTGWAPVRFVVMG